MESKRPYNLQCIFFYLIKVSFEFFHAVKFNAYDKVVQFVNSDKRYLYEVDYFHQTPLHWAAKRGYFDLMTFLIQKEPNLINEYDHNKRTALFLAAKNNQTQICQFLLNKQANPLLEDSEKVKPVDTTTDPVLKKLINDFMEVKF